MDEKQSLLNQQQNFGTQPPIYPQQNYGDQPPAYAPQQTQNFGYDPNQNVGYQNIAPNSPGFVPYNPQPYPNQPYPTQQPNMVYTQPAAVIVVDSCGPAIVHPFKVKE